MQSSDSKEPAADSGSAFSPAAGNRRVMEKMLELRANSYLYGIRSELLSQVVFGLKTTQSSARKMNRAFSDMLTRISHEIRTQLNSIMGMLNMMSSSSADNLSLEQKELLSRLNNTSRRLLNLSYNLIQEYDDLRPGDQEQNYSEVSVPDLIHETLVDLSQLDKFQNLSFPDPASQAQISIQINHLVFRSTLSLLGSILLDHLHKQDRLFLSYDLVDKQSLLFCYKIVSPEPDRLHPLLQFFKDRSNKMGLMFLENQFKHINGHISIKEDRQGLYIYLRTLLTKPINESIQSLSTYVRSPGKSRPSNERPLLLYIDDNPTSLKIYGHLIERTLDIEVETASSGQSGLAFLEKELPNLILLDIRMPVLDGLQIMQLLQKNSELKKIPVLAFTADEEAFPGKSAQDLGFKDLIPKPVLTSDLIHQIKTHMRN